MPTDLKIDTPGVGDAAASCDESTGDAERGAGDDGDAGEADWATYQAQSRQMYVTQCSEY